MSEKLVEVQMRSHYSHSYWVPLDPERLTGRWKQDEEGKLYVEYRIITKGVRKFRKVSKPGLFGYMRSVTEEYFEDVLQPPKFFPEERFRISEIHSDTKDAPERVKAILTSK